MKKNIIKLIIFILIFCILLYCIVNLLWIDKTSISYFYDEPKNSLDVVYVGASNVHHYFNSTLAYNLYGYTTGFMSADSQPFPLIKYCIKESEKYQNPSLYVIDIAKVAEDTNSYDTINPYDEASIRRTTDSFKFSINRINAINEVLSYKNDVSKDEYINYYFSFSMYHNRWKQALGSIKSKFLPFGYYKGYKFIEENTKIEPQDTYIWTQEIEKLKEKNKQTLIDLIDYIKDNKLNVLFVVPIRVYEIQLNKEINDAIRIIEENELNVINFNTLSDFNNNIDFSKDLYNNRHLNVYGATKYTLYFSKYLKENYNLPDHRGDDRYKSWGQEYERFKTDYKKITNKEFDDLLNEYNR